MPVLMLIGASLREGFFMLWETLWALVLGFGLSGAVQAFVSRGEMQRALGGHGSRDIGRATFFGMISSSCSYAATAMAKSLFQKGADFTATLVFMFASTNLVVELGIVLWVLLGWQFTASEFIGGAIMIGLLTLLARVFVPASMSDNARQRLQAGDDGHGGGMAEQDSKLEGRPWRERLGSLGGWADAASYAMADLTMLRRELLIGYGVAGFLAVLVPNSVWAVVFVTGHGTWTSVENALVGPLIAVISFVCSIGNVPLAAALWVGGISFGGVVSFIFADLITFPLLLIYRKYYGARMTVRMVALSWLVMAAAGLITEYLFVAAGLVPSQRPVELAPEGFQWNYTTVLNIVFLAVFGVLYWLSRNQQRFGGGLGYALDPVCGMQVEIAHAPARAERDGRTYYFCSDHCREHFWGQHVSVSGSSDDTATDPVCGMTVAKVSAAATRSHEGQTYWFCGGACAAEFERAPDEYAKGAVQAG
ncbi:MAG TPA: permease [Chloroflexota bacterium]|nr:permease [Chloroflexota bacterium]